MRVNWNNAWKTALQDASVWQNRINSGEYWNGKAAAIAEKINCDNKRINGYLSRIDLRPGDRVIDIGSGPGTLTVPMARVCHHVTAVDPSRTMLDYLDRRAREKGVNNYTTLNISWEDFHTRIHSEPVDVVVACNCLIMPDMKRALLKMNRAARRRVCLFRFAGQPFCDIPELQSIFEQGFFRPNPDYIYLVNILHQCGIYADVDVFSETVTQVYKNRTAPREELFRQFSIPETQDQGPIDKFLDNNLIRKGNSYLLKYKINMAMISWEKK